MNRIAPSVQVEDIRVIGHAAQVFCVWPTVFRRNNGELLVTCSGHRQHHMCPFGQVQVIKSCDDGETWQAHRVLVDGPLDDRDCGILETSHGTLIVNWLSFLAWEYFINHTHAKDRPEFLSYSEEERNE